MQRRIADSCSSMMFFGVFFSIFMVSVGVFFSRLLGVCWRFVSKEASEQGRCGMRALHAF